MRSALARTSPLTRGKLFPRRLVPFTRRNIPAHAGKTCENQARQIVEEEHPRSRGENNVPWIAKNDICGTSPLTRGKHAVCCAVQGHEGNIPAHAGKTSVARIIQAGLTEHPRSRGENAMPGSASTESEGTSPLTRGKHKPMATTLDTVGNIPAHAGKTHWRLPDTVAGEEHPRSRGENTSELPTQNARWGTSPLTRGKQLPISLENRRVGNIPAHAGKTIPLNIVAYAQQEHPRSRGENK